MILREIMPFYCEYGKPRASGDDPAFECEEGKGEM